MNKAKLILTITVITLILTGCSGCDECAGLPTYRKEVGVGYVFKDDSPVEGAIITVKSIYSTSGLFGKTWIVAEESFITDAEGRYQVRFVEKGCYTKHNGDKEMVYCNLYRLYCNGKRIIGFYGGYINNNSQNNILILDTIK